MPVNWVRWRGFTGCWVVFQLGAGQNALHWNCSKDLAKRKATADPLSTDDSDHPSNYTLHFQQIKISRNCSWNWRKLLRLRDYVQVFFFHKIEDSRGTSLWYDNWHPLGPLVINWGSQASKNCFGLQYLEWF
ncbi:hypothetical protein DVH24_021636 [Malus domestica]|uniref:Reverse transcriptase zinc-binding domain-containing protein n=1 Tax=Malus domestica TaxID=3750 RepID=A0A498K1N7_MALDO|nr:hypothetical protein DVH24_021636 [Malus domestica]